MIDAAVYLDAYRRVLRAVAPFPLVHADIADSRLPDLSPEWRGVIAGMVALQIGVDLSDGRA